MNANTKRLLIILVVVAVAAYFVWKNRKDEGEGKGETPNSPSGTSSVDKNSTESIIASLKMPQNNETHRQYLRYNCDLIEGNLTRKSTVEAKAEKNGVTYAQQAVMDASYLIFFKEEGGKWVERWNGAYASWHKPIVDQVMAL